jgi:hypothetical protein
MAGNVPATQPLLYDCAPSARQVLLLRAALGWSRRGITDRAACRADHITDRRNGIVQQLFNCTHDIGNIGRWC